MDKLEIWIDRLTPIITTLLSVVVSIIAARIETRREYQRLSNQNYREDLKEIRQAYSETIEKVNSFCLASSGNNQKAALKAVASLETLVSGPTLSPALSQLLSAIEEKRTVEAKAQLKIVKKEMRNFWKARSESKGKKRKITDE